MIAIDGNQIRVIDAHVHVFPDDVGRNREAWLLRDDWFRQLYENPLSRLATAEELIASMDAAGVDHSIVCGFPWSDLDHCRFHNEYMAETSARWPDRLSWLGITNPGRTGAVAQADWCVQNGARGMGEFNADAQGFRWEDPAAFTEIGAFIVGLGLPILVHASEPVGHLYPGKGRATPDQIAALARAWPELRIVAAHWGGGLVFYELMPSARPHLANLAYDSAATTYLYDQTIFRHAIDIAGEDKVLFASDYPVLGQQRLLQRVTETDWPSVYAMHLVMHGNAERVYRLAAPS